MIAPLLPDCLLFRLPGSKRFEGLYKSVVPDAIHPLHTNVAVQSGAGLGDNEEEEEIWCTHLSMRHER